MKNIIMLFLVVAFLFTLLGCETGEESTVVIDAGIITEIKFFPRSGWGSRDSYGITTDKGYVVGSKKLFKVGENIFIKKRIIRGLGERTEVISQPGNK